MQPLNLETLMKLMNYKLRTILLLCFSKVPKAQFVVLMVKYK